MAEQVQEDIRTGQISGADGRRTLTGVFRAINQVREQTNTLAESEARSSAEVQRDPAEVQVELLGKFPALRDSLPAFSREMFAE